MMGMKLETKLASELSLMEDNKALKIQREKAYQWATIEKKKTEEEGARADEATKRVGEATKRTKQAMAVKAINLWRETLESDTLPQDAYVVALDELVKHIDRERPNFDLASLVKSLEEQKKELQRLWTQREFVPPLLMKSWKTMSLLPKIPQLLSFPPQCLLNIKLHV